MPTFSICPIKARTSAVAVARSTSYSAKSASTSSSSVRSSCNVFQSSNPLSLRLSIPWSFWAVSPTGIKICSPAISRSTNSLVAFKLPPSVANAHKPLRRSPCSPQFRLLNPIRVYSHFLPIYSRLSYRQIRQFVNQKSIKASSFLPNLFIFDDLILHFLHFLTVI